MTLNVVVLHPECIYVAADFLLVDANTFQPYVEPSMKVVHFGYENGVTGVITYAGIGGIEGRSTAEIVAEWLTGPELLTLDEVAELVRAEGSTWLRDLVRRTRRAAPPAHSFVVVGYEAGGGKLLLVSNFETADGRNLERIESELQTTQVNCGKSAHVSLTGQPRAVRREHRKLLARTVDSEPLNSARIRHSMLSMIERASTTNEGTGLVSSNGAVVSLQPGGSSQFGLGEPAGVDTFDVFNGQRLPGTTDLFNLLGFRRGDYQLVASTSVQGSSSPTHQGRCTRSIISAESSPYLLVELEAIGNGRQIAIAINGAGTILGSSADEHQPGAVHYWLRSQDGTTELIPLREPSYQPGGGFDARGNIYLSRGGAHLGHPRLVRLTNGVEHDLEAVDGLPSTMSSVSGSGWVGGSVEVLDDNTRADRVRPARWDPEGRLSVADDWHPGFGGGVRAVASDGTALLVYTQLGYPARCALWRPDGEFTHLPGVPEGQVFPCGISDEGLVVGVRISPAGRIAVVARPDGTWQKLGTPDGWEPERVTVEGWVLGSVKVDGFNRPSLRDEAGDIVSQPAFRHHHCHMIAASGRGDIVGNAGADHCSHAVLWRRNIDLAQ